MNVLEAKKKVVLKYFPSKVIPLKRACYSKGEVTEDRTDFLMVSLEFLGYSTIKELKEYLPECKFTYDGIEY